MYPHDQQHQWRCKTCSQQRGARYAYPPSVDVYCADCGGTLDAIERGAVALSELAKAMRVTSGRAIVEQDRAARMTYTADDVAAMLGVKRKAVYAMAERAQIPGVMRIGKRRLVFRASELIPWLKGRAPPSGRNRR